MSTRIKRQPFITIRVEFVSMDEIEDSADEQYEPYAMLRAKAELLGDFLGCTADQAERLILKRITEV